MVREPYRGLMVSSGVEGEPFLGVVNADDQDIAFAMTNLTNDVLMFDIGGEAREIEEEYWERKDTSFYTGKHRNDRRINQSNILYPFRTNICDRNFQSHTAESNLVQTLHVKAAAAATESTDTAADGLASALQLHVYPKKNTPNEQRFESTQWGLHDTVIVVANPALLNEPTECNLVRGDALKEASEHLSVPPEQLLQMLGVERDAFEAVPSDIQHEALNMLINVHPMLQLLAHQQNEQQAQPSDTDTPTSSAPAHSGVTEFGAQPAALTVGNSVRKQRMGGTLVEKFLFDHHSAPCTIALAVKTGLTMCDNQGGVEELVKELEEQVDSVMSGREQALLECVPSIFEPEAQCVVCLNAENESPPDCVLYQCGHRCVHFECAEQLHKCPMCRSLISAVLRV